MAVFQHNGRSIGYLHEGAGAPILAFHGTTQSSNAWDQVRAACSEDRTWVVVEFPGSGETPMPDGPIDLNVVINDAVALMGHLGFNSFHVIGYSLGAVAALQTAACHPSEVLTATSLCGWSQSDARMRVTFDLWRRLLAIGPDLFMRYAVADGYSVSTIEMLEPMMDTVANMAHVAIQPGSDAHLELDMRVDIEDSLSKIACPTLVMGGLTDRWVDISKSRHIASVVANARLEELHSGHLCIGEIPDTIAQLIVSHTR